MHPDQRRLRRLQRLEQIRAIAKQAAAQDAAAAEGTLQQLRALADRTRAMAHDYRGRAGPSDGYALRLTSTFVAGLSGIATSTSSDARQAQLIADRKQHELAIAERARAAVQDRAAASERALTLRFTESALGARRAIGTELE